MKRWSDALLQLLESDNMELRQANQDDPRATADQASGTLIVIASHIFEQKLPKEALHKHRLCVCSPNGVDIARLALRSQVYMQTQLASASPWQMPMTPDAHMYINSSQS
jgi:hypothetical protein